MDVPTFVEARRALQREETRCETLVSSFLERIDARNDALNALVYVDAEGALNHARYLDSQRARGNDRPLAGLVLAVKDTISVRNQPLTCGSKMLAGFEAVYDATVIQRLRQAGAIFIGKANCDAFGMGSSNESSHFGPVQHPTHPGRVPGGSSGGSAAAVAAGFCHMALGTDTGGSIRQPAAFCGLAGLKPTYGRVSRYGLVAHASSMDTLGPLARTVEDAAHLFQTLAGPDPHDATCADVDVPDYRHALGGSVEGLRIGLPAEYFAQGVDAGTRRTVRAALDRLVDAGAELVEVSLPHTEYGVATYYVLATAEAASNLARYDGVRYGHCAEAATPAAANDGEEGGDAFRAMVTAARAEGFEEEVKRRLMLGTFVLREGSYDDYVAKAQRVRRLVRHDFARAFEQVDVLATPATPTPAFEQGSKTDDPLAMYLSDVYTVPASLAGLPALVAPAGVHPDAPHLPVGLQLVGRPFDEALLLQMGHALAQTEDALATA
jgi:aspartyl-tRNA(Asn)/glutamyl-tRNA(Gln) amidotransferase subunit A